MRNRTTTRCSGLRKRKLSSTLWSIKPHILQLEFLTIHIVEFIVPHLFHIMEFIIPRYGNFGSTLWNFGSTLWNFGSTLWNFGSTLWNFSSTLWNSMFHIMEFNVPHNFHIMESKFSTLWNFHVPHKFHIVPQFMFFFDGWSST